jgi:hypothetical protein
MWIARADLLAVSNHTNSLESEPYYCENRCRVQGGEIARDMKAVEKLVF